MRIRFLVVAAALSPLASPVALAQSQNEIDELREQIQVLEKRLDDAEAAQATEPPAKSTEPESAIPTSDNQSVGNSAFNPAITLIIDAHYRNLEQDPDTYQIGGFVPAGGHAHGEEDGGHGTGPGERGFSLAGSELTISANIDPYFLGYFTAFFGDGEVEVEEAWIQNSGFVPGVVAKLGRFFSGIGYLNEQHPHSWDFVDTPLVYKAFMGGNLVDDGIQLRYLAPTPVYLEFGTELGSGRSFPGSDRNSNGVGAVAAFVHVGGDVGFSNSYRIGATYRDTDAAEREYDDTDSTGAEIENVFSDLASRLWGMDFVWKWAPDGDPSVRNFKFQTEYYQRKETGQLGYDLDDATGTFAQQGDYSSDQGGWYAQAIFQFAPRWRVGLRYDQLDSGTLDYDPISNGSISRDDLQLLRDYKPTRTTMMIDFSTSEFGLFRLQYAQDKARFDVTDDQIVFQYIVSLGSHGAHKF